MALKIVQNITAITISNSGIVTSGVINLQSGYLRMTSSGGNSHVHVIEGSVTGIANTESSFLIPQNTSEILKFRVARQQIAGITTGTSTTITFAENAGVPFIVGDRISILSAQPSGLNTSFVTVSSINPGANSMIVNTNTSSVVGVITVTNATVSRCVKVEAYAETNNTHLHIAEVQIASQAQKMKLITEEVQKVNFITEGRGASKKMFIEGTFLQGGVKNRNNREYPVHILEREVNRYNETFVQKGRALGELGHPDGPTVNLDRVSHMITSLVREGNNFNGRAQLLSTPMGKIAQSLIGEGVTLGVSSRGVGSLLQTNEGHKVVGEYFMLATAADLVADPSAPDAFVQGIMEGKEWCWDGGILKEQAAKKTYKRINTLVDQKILDEHKVNLFQEFLSNL